VFSQGVKEARPAGADFAGSPSEAGLRVGAQPANPCKTRLIVSAVESIPANTMLLEPSASKAALGEVGTLVAEAGRASAPASFASLLQAVMPAGSMQESSAAEGQATRQNGQTLTGPSGNFWPVLLSVGFSQDALPAVVSAQAGSSLPHGNKRAGDSAAAELPSGAQALLPPPKSPTGDAGLFRPASDGLEGARQGENRLSLMSAAADEANLQLSGIATSTADSTSQNVFHATTGPTTPPEIPVPTEPQRFVISPRLDAPQWDDAFASRLVWMVKEKHQLVELRLNPPELGLINVRMALRQNDAAMAIGVHNATVREAIEASLPRLRELLAESGVSLMNVDVSTSQGHSGGGGGAASGHEGYDSLYSALAGADNDLLSQVETGLGTLQSISKGMVDHYA
jgi:flagellar hook-length control protein FliK